MRRSVATLAIIAALAVPAMAQTRVAAIRPPSTLGSIQKLEEVSVSAVKPSDPDVEHKALRANREVARVKMEKFDLAIASRGDRALRSVCIGCLTTAKWASRRIEARAEAREFPIADPAAAPTQ